MYLVKSGTLSEVGLQSVGMAIIRQNLRYAAIKVIHEDTPSHRAEEIAESVAFVQGSSLDIIIDVFDIPVDAQKLRDSFYDWANRQRRKLLNGYHKSAS